MDTSLYAERGGQMDSCAGAHPEITDKKSNCNSNFKKEVQNPPLNLKLQYATQLKLVPA